MKHTVFISHSSADKAVADQICHFLESHGIQCWIAPRDVMPGKNYGAAILDGIDDCSVFLLVLTSQSNKSGQVVREVERAASSNSVIIPFRVEEVQPSRDLEFYVSAAHWLNATSRPLNKHLHQLLEAIRNWQQSQSSKEEAPAAAIASPEIHVAPDRPHSLFGFPLWALIAILLGLLLLSAFGYFALQRKAAAPSSIATGTATPSQLETLPSPATIETETPAAEESVAPVAPVTAESVVSPTPEKIITPSPLRLRPGAPIRPPTPLETASQVDTTLAASPSMRHPSEAVTVASASAQAASEPPPPVIREVIASSQYGKNRPSLAVDGNTNSSWITKTDGAGQSISMRFKTSAALTSVSILGGDGADPEQFNANNRVHVLRLYFSDGSTQVINLEDQMKTQRFEIELHNKTDWVRCEIVSVYRSKQNDRTAISEISFNTPK